MIFYGRENRNINKTVFLHGLYSRNFRTRLKRDASAFHPNVAIETSQGHVPYDVTSVYAGTISGDFFRA